MCSSDLGPPAELGYRSSGCSRFQSAPGTPASDAIESLVCSTPALTGSDWRGVASHLQAATARHGQNNYGVATNPLATLSDRHRAMPLNRSRCEPSRTGGSKSTPANAPMTASVGCRRSRYRGQSSPGASTFGVYLTGKLTTRSPVLGRGGASLLHRKSARIRCDGARPTIISTKITRLM